MMLDVPNVGFHRAREDEQQIARHHNNKNNKPSDFLLRGHLVVLFGLGRYLLQ